MNDKFPNCPIPGEKSGFSFDNCRRNAVLESNGYAMPKMRKTGTTIVGIMFADGVIVGADTRATEGDIVADKNCMKIHYLQPNIFCCGAGTAADTEMTTLIMSSKLELLRQATGRPVRVVAACRLLKQLLFKYQGHIGAYLILGGWDDTGSHISSISAHGHSDVLPYATMGSGSLAAMSVFEDRFKPQMDKESAMKLVRDAVCSGIKNDMGSGSNVDLCCITKAGSEPHRTYEVISAKGERKITYGFPKGATTLLKPAEVKKINYDVIGFNVRPISSELDTGMDTS